ncbi:HAD domain-containing protein [Plantactinospora sp. B5E13]|uniref:HAD domain-containing protein n=1 Tax=Plantactinospora sp. B5E13 TaxID=3153758 RepID=UPI00325D24D7
MSLTTSFPLIFLDVDGTLIPFGGGRTSPVNQTGWSTPTEEPGNPLLARLDPALGPRLAALPGQLVWATTWMDEANTELSPRLGLPALPVVDWPDEPAGSGPPVPGLHWKTAGLVDRTAGRTFVWVDDEITDLDRAWVAAHHPGPALLYRVEPHLGLVESDVRRIADWLRGLAD